MTGPSPTIEAAFAGRLGDFALDAAFTIPARGVTALFGPSGCGKTTILRCLAGLTRLPGRLSVAGEVWQDDRAEGGAGTFLPPHRRPIGYVFQEASLFPHLSVEANLRFGARRAAREGADGPRLDFGDVVSLLGLSGLLKRGPQALSGGERQRVAIGRALLARPRLLLMDEPLAALDRMTRDGILPYLEGLHAALSVPVVYVSHDMGEVERLADTLVLVEGGRVRASGGLAALEADPDLPLLRGQEAAVTFPGEVAEIDEAYALTRLNVAGGSLVVAGRHGRPGDRRRLRVRASDVSFVLSPATDTTILNCLPARIASITPHDAAGAQVNVVADLGEDGTGARILGRVTRRSAEVLGLSPGGRVYAQVKGVALLASGEGPAAP